MVRFVELEQTDGDVILVNPADVAAIEDRKDNVRLLFRNGEEKTVIGTAVEVAAKLEES